MISKIIISAILIFVTQQTVNKELLRSQFQLKLPRICDSYMDLFKKENPNISQSFLAHCTRQRCDHDCKKLFEDKLDIDVCTVEKQVCRASGAC